MEKYPTSNALYLPSDRYFALSIKSLMEVYSMRPTLTPRTGILFITTVRKGYINMYIKIATSVRFSHPDAFYAIEKCAGWWC